MKKFIIGTLVVLLVLIIGVCSLPFLIPSSTYARVAETKLEEALGREVTLGSDTKITIFPNIGAKITSVEIANAEGFEDPHFLKADALSVAVKWLPLLSRKVEIASLKFEGADLALHQKSATENNWTFSPAETPTEDTDDSPASGPPAFDTVIPKAELINSKVVFRDDVSDQVYSLDPINLTARIEGLDAPANLTGDITINGLRLDISAEVSSPLGLSGPDPISVRLKLNSEPAELAYEGSLALSEAPEFDGNFNLNLKDAEQIMSITNIEMDQDLSAIGTVKASAKVSGTPDYISATGVSASVDGKNLTASYEGDVTVANNTPSLTGRVKAKSGSLRKLLSDFQIDLASPTDQAYKSFDIDVMFKPSGNMTMAEITSLKFDDLDITGSAGFDLSGTVPKIDADLAMAKVDVSPYLSKTAQQNQSGAGSDEWSEEPIDLSALKLANGDVNISIGELTDGRASVRDLKLSGKLNNGTFNGTITSEKPETGRTGAARSLEPLYDGSMAMATSITARNDGSASIRANTNGSGIATAALIKIFTGMDVLQGVASLDADITTQGHSVAAFVQNLDGNYRADVVDGAIFGINLPQLVRAAQEFLSAGKLPSALSPSEKTDFSSLSLNGNITKGVTAIQAFELQAPYVRASASGTIDLVNRTLDIRFQPKAVTTGQGQNSEAGIQGFGIPLKITGNWTSIKGSLDTSFLTDLVKKEATNRLTDELSSRVGGDLGSVLDSALGIKREQSTTNETATEPAAETNSEEEAEEEEPEDIAKSLLRDLLTRPKD